MEEQGNLGPSFFKVFLSLRFRNMNKIENWSTKNLIQKSRQYYFLSYNRWSVIIALIAAAQTIQKNLNLETKHGPVIRRMNKLAAILE